MININNDDINSKDRYIDLANECFAIIQAYGGDWTPLYDEDGSYLCRFREYRVNNFSVTAYHNPERDGRPAGYGLFVKNGNTDLYIYDENTKYYERNSNEEWLDYIHKLSTKAFNTLYEWNQEKRKAFDIVRNSANLLIELDNLEYEVVIKSAINDTKRALNRCGIEVATSVCSGDVYEFVNNYNPTSGCFRIYYVFYNHELVAKTFSDISYDFTKHVLYNPGPWLQKLNEITKAKSEQYCDIIRRSHL